MSYTKGNVYSHLRKWMDRSHAIRTYESAHIQISFSDICTYTHHKKFPLILEWNAEYLVVLLNLFLLGK